MIDGIRIGDSILFKSDNRILSLIIKKFTQSDYSHAGIITGVRNLGDQIYVDVVESRLIKNVHKSTYLLDKNTHSIYTHIYLSDADAKSVGIRAYDYIGKKYDIFGVIYRSLLTITFNRRKPNKWNDKGRYYCSELVASIYNIYDVKFSETLPVENITPDNIALSKSTRKVF